MDRALKERLIGAIVLVVAAVLIVPVFLDGPADDGEVVTERVTLPGQNDQPRMQQTIVLERDRDEPVPVVSAAPEPAPIEQPEPASVSEPEKAPPPVPQKTQAVAEKVVDDDPPAPRDATPATGSLWAVQLGSFSNRANAEKLAADLRAEGYAAFLSGLSTNSGELLRVRVGPQKDRESAEGVASSLASAGHKGQVVAHP